MKRYIIYLMTLMFMTLSGCAKQVTPLSPEQVDTASIPEVVGSISQENLSFVVVGMGTRYFPDSKDDGLYYAAGDALAYLDLTTGNTAVLCPQAGCAHNNGSCPAYLDSACAMAVYKEAVYTIKEDGRALMVMCFLPGETSRNEVCSIIGREGMYMRYNAAKISHGNILLEAVETGAEDEWLHHLYLLRVKSGVISELATWSDTEYVRILGASANTGVVEFDTYIGQPPQRADYSEDEDYIAAWESFQQKSGVTELRLYDLNSGTYRVLADSQSDGYAYSVDPHLCYNDLLLYRLGDGLWLYDLTDNTATLQLEQPDIVNYFILDSRIITVTRNGEEGCAFYYTDIDGETFPLPNGGYSDYLHFTPSCETESYFIGLYTTISGYCQISKADFYSGNYESTVLLSSWE